MSSDPRDVEIEALRADNAKLRTDLEAAATQRAELVVKLGRKIDRIGVLEQACADFRTILDRHAPAPQTDLQAAVDEFVSKLPKR